MTSQYVLIVLGLAAVMNYDATTAATLKSTIKNRQFNSAVYSSRQSGPQANNGDDSDFESQGPDDFDPNEFPNSNGESYNQGNSGFNNQASNSQINSAPTSGNRPRPNQRPINNNAFTTVRSPTNVIFNENTIEAQTRDCLRNRCTSTNEYNPVCGNDNITYTNSQKLRCAQLCNRDVQMQYKGSCVTTRAPNT